MRKRPTWIEFKTTAERLGFQVADESCRGGPPTWSAWSNDKADKIVRYFPNYAGGPAMRLNDGPILRNIRVRDAITSLNGHRAKRLSAANADRRQKLWDQGVRTCYYCDRPLSIEEVDHPHRATLEHIRRLVDGGTNRPRNLTLACWMCNTKRQGHGAEEWRELRKRGLFKAPAPVAS